MPARDGTGPLGQGSRTGRGMGNCISTSVESTQTPLLKPNKPFNWGGRVWDISFGSLFGRRRSNRMNR